MNSKGGCANQLNTFCESEKTIAFSNKRILLLPLMFFLFVTMSIIVRAQPSNYSWDKFGSGTSTMSNNSPANGIISQTFQAPASPTNYYLVQWDGYANKWSNTSTPYNSVFTLNWGGGSFNGSNGAFSVAPSATKRYTMQIRGLGYSNRQAVVMETDNAPIGFNSTASTAVSTPVVVAPGSAISINITLAGAKSSQERVFIRYSPNADFSSSKVVEATGIGSTWTTASATIPGADNTAGVTIRYYAFTTTVAATNSSDFDLITLSFGNNGGSNYSYTVASNFYSKSSGNLESTSSWTTDAAGVTGAAPVDFAQAGVTYNIRNNATPTIAGSWTVSGTNSKIVVGNGTNACNFTVPGTFVVSSPNIDISNAGTITRTSSAASPFVVSGTFSVLAGGTYVHNFATGTLPTVSWASTSNLNIDVDLATNQFDTRTFGNVNINNSAGVTMFTSTAAGQAATIGGSLTINSTGNVIVSNVTTQPSTLTINGNLTISSVSGTFYIESTGTGSSTLTKRVLVNGNYIQSSGDLNLGFNTSNTISANSRYSILEVKGDFTHTSGNIIESATDVDYVAQILLSKTSGTQNIESVGNTIGLIEFNVSGSGAQCVVPVNKTFDLSGTQPTFIVANGASSVDLNILGRFKRTSTNPVTINASAVVRCDTGGTYEHAVDGGSVPTCTWSSGSTFEVTGISAQTSFTSGAVQSYHHVVWNCTGQSSMFSFGGLTTVNGNFTIQSTGASPGTTSCLLLTNSTAITTTIAGNLTVSGGYFAPFGASTASSSSLNISGNLSVSGGSFDIYRPAANTGTINLAGDFSMSSGTITKGGSGTANFNFAKSGTQTYSKSGGTISNAINFIVNNGSTLNMGTSVLDGSTGSFTLSSGGGLITANSGGIASSGATGSIQVTGTRTYNTGANYTFNGSSAQATGAGFTGAANLTINNSAGVTLTSSASLSGALSLTNGTFNVGSSNTIIVASGGSITATSGSLASGTGAGTFTFLGTGSVAGTVGFNNVNIAGGVNFGLNSTINGTLTINSGGFVNTNAPIYATGSTLRYNSGGTYGRSTEWSNTFGAGYPNNVSVTGNTTLNLVNSVNSYKKAAGNLTVDAGSTFSVADLTVGSSGVGVEFLGNIINNGTISLNTTSQRLKAANLTNGYSNGTATIILSGVIGGDLELTGNYEDNANFTANSRAVFFTGTTDVQTIGGNALAPFNIDYIFVTKASGTVQLDKNILTTALTIVSGGVNLGEYVVSGSGSFAISSGATLTTSHAGGLGASIAVTGTKTFNAGANYVFSGNTSTPFPSTPQSIGNPANVTIDATVTLNRTIGSGTLTINALKSLVVPNAQTLTVSGTITNSGTLDILSGGQLLQGSDTDISGGGQCIYRKDLPLQPNSALSGFNRSYYIGSPVVGSTSTTPINITSVLGSSTTGLNMYGYTETNNSWPLYYSGTLQSQGSTFDIGKGYFVNSSSGTYFSQANFTGNSFNNGDVTVTLTNTAGQGGGYNLISNPYPSGINWSDIYNDASNTSLVGSSYWLRTYDTGGAGMVYKTCNASGVSTQGLNTIISPATGFWVKYTGTSPGTFTFKNAMRTSGAGTYYTMNANRIIRLDLGNGTYDDQAVVYLNEDAGLGIESYDSDKRIPSTTVHQLYSLEGTTKLAINGFNNALAKDTVLLGMQIPTAGTYTINASQIDATIEEDVFLEDKITGAYQNMKTTPSYSFTSTQGTFNNRFVLHFAPFVPALPGQTAATAIAMPTSNWPQCNNVTSEDQWHAFTATSEGISIEVNTASTDIVIELQDGTGNVVAQENAVNGIGNETLNFFGLTAGQIYKVGVRNNISSQPTGTYGICVKSLKRGGCDYGAGPYSLCQYYKATWAGSTGVSYTFTFTGTSGPAAGQTFTRTQNSDICVLSTVTPLLPYGSTYDVVISNTYTLTDGAGNTEQISVPSNSGCQVVTIAQPQTTLSNSSSCNNGPRFRGAVVSSLPWVCGTNNWRWRFTEVNPLTMQTVGLPIELNRGAASNFLSLGSVPQLQNGKTYAVQTAPMFTYTGTNYNWGPTQYMCIVGAAGMTLEGADAEQGVAQGQHKDALQIASMVYVTEGNHVNIQLNNTATNTAKRADIYDVTGKCVKSIRLVEGMNQVELSEASGIYMVRTTVGNQSETTRVFIQK